MFSGLQHGVIRPAEPYGLPLNLTTLPEMLKKAGKIFYNSSLFLLITSDIKLNTDS